MKVISNDNAKLGRALDALRDVLDPEIGLNIVDLGLLYQIDFDETEKKIYCLMTLTTQFCPMGKSITDTASAVLESTFPGYTILIELTFDPPWSHTLISEEGREFLNTR